MPKAMTQIISQYKLRRYLQLKTAIAELAVLQLELLGLHKNGAEQQDGPLKTVIATTAGKRNPKWKDAFTTLAEQHYGKGEGDKKATEVLSATDKGPDSQRIQVLDTRTGLVV